MSEFVSEQVNLKTSTEIFDGIPIHRIDPMDDARIEKLDDVAVKVTADGRDEIFVETGRVIDMGDCMAFGVTQTVYANEYKSECGRLYAPFYVRSDEIGQVLRGEGFAKRTFHRFGDEYKFDGFYSVDGSFTYRFSCGGKLLYLSPAITSGQFLKFIGAFTSITKG